MTRTAPSRQPASAPRAASRATARSARGGTSGVAAVVGVVVGAGIGLQIQSLPFNLQPVDALLVLLVFFAVVGWTRGADGSARLLVGSLPWLWLIALGSVLGLAVAGLPAYGAVAVSRDAFTFSLLFATLAWLRNDRGRANALLIGMIGMSLVCCYLILRSGDSRPSGTFDNPNLAAHFLATVLLLTLARVRRAWHVLPLAAVILYAMLRSSSFGALLMLAAAASYWLFFRAPFGTRARKLLVALLVVGVGFATLMLARQEGVFEGSQLNAERYDRSSNTRFEVWRGGLKLFEEAPLGVGPGSVSNEALVLNQYLELHNEPLAYLVERGPLGLLGLIGLVVVLWRAAQPGGAARLLMSAYVAASLLRETLNYRHLWIALAVAFALDNQRRGACPPAVLQSA